MANASRTGEKGKGLGHEILGIALLALALYVAVSVFSWPGGAEWGGVAGQYISGAAFAAIGYTAYILPLFLFVIGFKLLLRRALTISTAAPVSIGVFMVAASGLMAHVTGDGVAGGAMGQAITVMLGRYTGRTGTLVVLVALIVVSVLAFSGISKKRRAPKQAAVPSPPAGDGHHGGSRGYGGEEDVNDEDHAL
ncbi:MAG: DNA translocase FtsK 4TM domain-containing protein [Thermodesulfobacteriota bacterium]